MWNHPTVYMVVGGICKGSSDFHPSHGLCSFALSGDRHNTSEGCLLIAFRSHGFATWSGADSGLIHFVRQAHLPCAILVCIKNRHKEGVRSSRWKRSLNKLESAAFRIPHAARPTGPVISVDERAEVSPMAWLGPLCMAQFCVSPAGTSGLSEVIGFSVESLGDGAHCSALRFELSNSFAALERLGIWWELS
jgi:hypothetical protein